MNGFFSFIKFLLKRSSKTAMTIDEFLKASIVDLVGLGSAPESVKRDFLVKASQMTLERIVEHVDGILPEAKKEEFYRVFGDGGSDEDMQKFIKENVPNFEEIVGEETARVKVDLVKAAEELKAAA